MLNNASIEELKRIAREGDKAKELLKAHTELKDIKESLVYRKNKLSGCRKITIEYDYQSNIEITINEPFYAIGKMDEIIDNEIEFIDNKLRSVNDMINKYSGKEDK